MNRKIAWVSSIDEENKKELDALETTLKTFYETSESYYSNIDFATAGWANDPINRDILRYLQGRSRILEIGCGAARILDHYPDLASRYTGVDFSFSQLNANRSRHPKATFVQLKEPGSLPLPNDAFDCVFSVFVLEHTVRPRLFLDESIRVLATNGYWLMRCPNFLGRGRMSSQRCGLSCGTGREKLRRGQIWDAAITAWDSRIRIPLKCWRLRTVISRNDPKRGFFVNTQPTCLEDPFGADRDAVYLTYRAEICRHLSRYVTMHSTSAFANTSDIYIVATKN